MPKDDYFVIAYQVLSYLYGCLKKSKFPADAVLSAEYFSIDGPYWDYIIQNLYQDGYITGVSVTQPLAKINPTVKIRSNIRITPKGIQYLEENSMLQKAKNVIKDIAAMIP